MTTVKFLTGLQAVLCLVTVVVLSICYVEESTIAFLIVLFEIVTVLNIIVYTN